jgi:hypothetical protein
MRRALLLLPLALLLAACGGGGGALSLDPVASAADKTAKQGSERFRLRVETGLPSGRYIAFTARGVVNNADGSGRASYVFSEGGTTFRAQAVLAGTTIYMRSKAFSGTLPEGKSWVKLDVEKLAKEAGAGSLREARQGTPTEPLKFLREAGKTTKVGPDRVAGVATTKYHTVVDAERAKLADELGTKRFPVDVWIDRKGLVRKISFDVSPPDPNKAAKFVYVLDGFGPTIEVEPPPADTTVDLSDLTS